MKELLGRKITFLILICLQVQSVLAQDRIIEVNVAGNFRPTGSQGILITSQGIINKPVVKVENLNTEMMVVSIPYTPQEIAEGAYATAVLFGPDGESAFGDVKLITDSLSTKSFYNMPECSSDAQIPEGLNQQVGLLESLVAIRVARREGHLLRLDKIFDSEFIEKLKRLEKGFGLRYNKALSKELTSFELVDRLSRLSNAIKNYQSTKK